MESIVFAVKCSLIITAIYASTWDGMVFGKQRSWMDSVFTDELGSFLIKPLYGCIICMASIWGGGIYLFMFGLNWYVIPHILFVAGINTIISGIIYLAYERNSAN